MMPHIFQRYPRYILLILFVLVGSFLFFQGAFTPHVHSASFVGLPGDPHLPARVQRAERAYQKVLEKRQELIQKHGPSPSSIMMYVPRAIYDASGRAEYTLLGFHPMRSRGQRILFVSTVVSVFVPSFIVLQGTSSRLRSTAHTRSNV